METNKPQYGKSDYWDERYSSPQDQFDWYQRFSGIRDVVTQYVKQTDRILHIGCGNSRLSEEMMQEGFSDITNIDISGVVIQQMKQIYPDQKFSQMDIRDLKFEDGAFESVIDKGTLDTILSGYRSTVNAKKSLKQIHRVLAPRGVYIFVSYGIPENRMEYLNSQEWNISVHKVAKPPITDPHAEKFEEKVEVHYVYVCKKDSRQF